MKLRQHIKKILNEIEFDDETKRDYRKKTNLIKTLVNDVFGNLICGFRWEPSNFVFGTKIHWPERNLGAARIILYIPKDNYQKLEASDFSKKKDLVQQILEFPIFNQVFVTFDTSKCGETHKEEETNESLLDDLGNFFRPKKRLEVDPSTIQSEKEKFTCEDCGDPNYQMYMVNDDIWREYGNNTNTLCMSCLEKRMGRKLTRHDFSQHRSAPVNKHNVEVQDILTESVKKHVSDGKKPFMRYEKLINMLVYNVFDEGICGLSWDVIKLNHREGISIRIILHFTEDSFRDFDYERYGQSKQELKVLIEDFLPKFDGIYIAYDTTKCGEDLNESELTERCWKGYTQKGMKTMFGKRYPNCVKIKKKKSIKESIRDILLQEVNKKFPKPTEKLEKVVYKWLDNYFKGSQIYEDEYWKYHGFSFKFCKNGREIADLRVIFEDKSPDWGPRDKRPTSERSVEEVKLYIYPVTIDELITDIPIRKNYLLYLIEEWFEDTKLDEIQRGFNRNDLSLDYVTVFEYKKRGDICVPLISKPEDITMQEMMDYIKKNTLFSYEDMEEHEEEQPGWIEELYLSILRGNEKERLNQEDIENNPEPFNDDY